MTAQIRERTKYRWIDNIKTNPQGIDCGGGREFDSSGLSQGKREGGDDDVKTENNSRIIQNAGNFLS